jgi:hypothetical protein
MEAHRGSTLVEALGGSYSHQVVQVTELHDDNFLIYPFQNLNCCKFSVLPHIRRLKSQYNITF